MVPGAGVQPDPAPAGLAGDLILAHPRRPGRQQSRGARPLIWTSGLAIVVFAGWLRAMWRVWKVLPGGRALWLSLLAHALLAGYVAAVVASFLLVGSLLWGGAMVGRALLLVPLIVAVAYVCRRGEKFIAQQCIRQYLLEARAPGTMSSP